MPRGVFPAPICYKGHLPPHPFSPLAAPCVCWLGSSVAAPHPASADTVGLLVPPLCWASWDTQRGAGGAGGTGGAGGAGAGAAYRSAGRMALPPFSGPAPRGSGAPLREWRCRLPPWPLSWGCGSGATGFLRCLTGVEQILSRSFSFC